MCFPVDPAPDTCSGSVAEAVHAFQNDGFAIFRRHIDANVLRELVDEYERVSLPCKHAVDVRREVHGIAGEDGAPRVVHVSNIYELPGLAHLSADPRLQQLASACLGGVRVRPMINPELFDKPPMGNGSTHTPPHQDNFYFQAPVPGIALWITLDQMDYDSGTVRYVRGSHLRGLRYHEMDWSSSGGFLKSIFDYTDEDEDFECDVGHLDPGDIVVHHGLTVHHAPPNLTSTRRRGLVINYVTEEVAYSLADDLYQPALVFQPLCSGHLRASVPEGWPDRQAFASTCVQCALGDCPGVRSGIPNSINVDGGAGNLIVKVLDHTLHRQAIIALVESGHVVSGADAVRRMPLKLGEFDVPLAPGEPKEFSVEAGRLRKARKGEGCQGRLPKRYLGVFRMTETSSDGITAASAWRFQTQSGGGAFLEIRCGGLSGSSRSSRGSACGSEVGDRSRSPQPEGDRAGGSDTAAALASLAGTGRQAVAGIAETCHDQGVVVRHHCMSYQPFDGTADVRRVFWPEESDLSLFGEVSFPEHLNQSEERWHRVGETPCQGPDDADSATVLDLIDDVEGRLGLWIIIGTWFGRVVGRGTGDRLSDIVCKSLAHAIQTYAEGWDMDPQAMVNGCSATVGRIEGPGAFRILYDFEDQREGAMLLDNCTRQLRRDSAEDDVLVEAWSGRRWRIREPPHNSVAFGTLKRTLT